MAKPTQQPAGERRLARAEIAEQRDDVAGPELLRKGATEPLGGVGIRKLHQITI
jgi:hypothetical protein